MTSAPLFSSSSAMASLVAECSRDEGRCLITGAAVDIGTIGQRLLDGGFIPGGDGVEQRITRGCRCRGERQH